jgi:hypothetical protein
MLTLKKNVNRIKYTYDEGLIYIIIGTTGITGSIF